MTDSQDKPLPLAWIQAYLNYEGDLGLFNVEYENGAANVRTLCRMVLNAQSPSPVEPSRDGRPEFWDAIEIEAGKTNPVPGWATPASNHIRALQAYAVSLETEMDRRAKACDLYQSKVEAELAALKGRIPVCPPCEMGENTECVCNAELVPKPYLDAVIAERDALKLKPVTGEGWQPIETAPKDTSQGHFLMFFGPSTGMRIAFCTNDHKGLFTHWQPLPTPPHAQGEK